jgi:hypothetical protein
MKTVETVTATIYSGLREGYDGIVHVIEDAATICRKYVDVAGLCVSITPTEFAYTNGSETGVAIGLINYPRFPSSDDDVRRHATNLALRLMDGLKQNRISIVMADKTFMLSVDDT